MSAQQWHEFLQNSNTEHPLHEISSSILEETVICDLSHLGLLKIQGTDALTFLQGQVTNDIKQLNGSNAHYTGYCNPKGRLLGLFLAFAYSDHIHLQFPKPLVEPIMKRLKMYVLRSKVDIQDVSDSMIKIGVNGSQAPAILSTLFSKIPHNDYELTTLNNGALLKLPGKQPRFEIFTDSNQAPTIWDALLKQAKPVNINVWEWLEIQAGIPNIVSATQEEFVPQMLNLDLIGGISFKKGCYTGQEIVARTHYLGTVKRRTCLAHLDTGEIPVAGDHVINATGEAVGKVVRSAKAPSGGCEVLTEIRLENLEGGELRINGIQIELRELPYKIQ